MEKINKEKIIIISKIIVAVLAVACISVLLFCCFCAKPTFKNGDCTLAITEYQIHNERTLYDSSWDTPDWIELYNYGDKDINLKDIYLSDDYDNLLKCRLPEVIIKPGEYKIIFASAKGGQNSNEIHLNFKLSENDGDLILSSGSEILYRYELNAMSPDISAGINQSEKWVYYYTPTPGRENSGNYSNSSEIQAVYRQLPKIIINEYMCSNKYTIRDEGGESFDWIELYNPNNIAVNLSDYYISDDKQELGKCRLPDYEIEAYGYVLMFASGDDSLTNGLHLPFSIGGTDEEIILCDYSGVIKDSCIVEQLPDDISAGVSQAGEWVYFSSATPGVKNSTPSSPTYDIGPYRESESPLVINEVMPSNKYGLLDCDGDTSDWLEIYNPSAEEIDMSGCFLTDESSDLGKWVFPDGASMPAGGYLVVFLSGKNKNENGELHTSFAIGSDDTEIILVDKNYSTIDEVAINTLPGNVSKGRLPDGGYGYFTLPTPGKENTGHYEEEIDISEDIILTDIFISEAATSYISYSQGVLYAFEEFIEIYNSSDASINLSGYSVIDDSGEPWYFPDSYISAGGYITLQLKGNSPESATVINADLSVSAEGEELKLVNSEGVIIDCYNTGFLTGDFSSGRLLNTGSRRYFFTEKTPTRKNSTSTMDSYTAQPEFSVKSGQIDEESILLELTCRDDAQIRYTTDGKYPTEKSILYTNPIYIDKDTVIKAVAFSEGKLPSTVDAHTYIFSRKHDLPIVCLSTSPVYLFSESSGILVVGSGEVSDIVPYLGANYWENWECRISFEYYDEDNNQALGFEAGLQVAGQFSRMYDQKSLVVRLRDEYGLNEVYYPFFKDSEVNEYKHILLRNSGQDIGVTKIKDYFIHQSVKGYTNLDIMDGYPVAVYINGQYWGLYNLREKQNEDYLASHYNVDKDDITIIKYKDILLAGDITEWKKFKDFLSGNDFSIKENYEEFCEMADVDAFIDYIIIQSFYGNYDIGNMKFWKAEGGKWRPLLFDTDMALVNATSHLNYLSAYFNADEYSFLFSELFKNESFRDSFVQRYAYFMNEVFTQERLESLIDELAAQIENEMVYHIGRYYSPISYEKWQQNIEALKQTIATRRDISLEQLQEVFELDDGTMEELFGN
ncbi:MAG: lamin tail domain-containing protein [Clostridia bacterium]|nr:lamin tail domain-containing protein [Clostridia bacterium]